MRPIWTNEGPVSPTVIIDPQPMSTSIKVPKNSAISILHMLLLSVISDKPKILSAPVKATNNYLMSDVLIIKTGIINKVQKGGSAIKLTKTC